jgi:hypothetical protein
MTASAGWNEDALLALMGIWKAEVAIFLWPNLLRMEMLPSPLKVRPLQLNF